MRGASLIIEKYDDIVCEKNISKEDMCTSEEKSCPQSNAMDVASVSHGRMEKVICRSQNKMWHAREKTVLMIKEKGMTPMLLTYSSSAHVF